MTTSHKSLNQTVENHRGNEELLQQLLQETKEKYQRSCDEVEELVSSEASLKEQHEVLSEQVTVHACAGLRIVFYVLTTLYLAPTGSQSNGADVCNRGEGEVKERC